MDAAAEDAARKDAASRTSWIERAWLNGLDGFYRGTFLGSGKLRDLAEMAREVEASPNQDREELLNRFYPGLKNSNWEENRQAKLQEIKSAPERYRKTLADLKQYEEMKGFDSVSEFGAAAAGQIVASLLSPESYVGWSVKGASWGVRAMKAAIQQGGIAGVADLETQRNLVAAGVQSEIDRWRTTGAVIGGAVVGGLTAKNGNAKSGHVGVTPEGPPKQQVPTPEQKEPASVAPRSDVQGVAPEAGLVRQCRRVTSRYQVRQRQKLRPWRRKRRRQRRKCWVKKNRV
ncbi:MAG: hypothetical protein JWO68_4298 [Actinomycetia bacterium]|nr:hypothetical protein [Actinomycetes bacterium]